MNKCRFNADKHSYCLEDENGEKIKDLISVTQMMQKHGLAPDLSGVPDEILNAKAQRGTFIHEEIATYIATGEVGMTAEFNEYVRIMDEHKLKPLANEQVVFNDYVAGTYDLLADCNGAKVLIDFKTTATLHREALAWQLGLYNYIGALDCKQFYAMHLLPEEGKLVEITPKPQEQIEALIKAEMNQTPYKAIIPKIDSDKLALLADCETQIALLKKQMREIEECKKTVYGAILSAMEVNATWSFKTDQMQLTYVAKHDSNRIDTERLRKDFPEIAEKYTITTKVKPSLRITLR